MFLNKLTKPKTIKTTKMAPIIPSIILFENDKLLSIKLVSQELSGVFKLSLNEKTEGVYFVGNSKLPLHFFLKKIKQNDLDIKIEYDIYSHEQLLSCNTLEIEVKKC